MDNPLDIQFKGWKDKGDIEELIRNKVAKLERVHNHIISCHVLVEQLHNEQHSGHTYHVRVAVNIPPHHEIVVKRDPEKGKIGEEYLSKIIRDAFDATTRRVKEIADRQHKKTKKHEKRSEVIEEEVIVDSNYLS